MKFELALKSLYKNPDEDRVMFLSDNPEIEYRIIPSYKKYRGLEMRNVNLPATGQWVNEPARFHIDELTSDEWIVRKKDSSSVVNAGKKAIEEIAKIFNLNVNFDN